ncbi:MAG: UDP-N-acetylmuramoyl-L-alanine--D-glutamate ligase [Thermomicrobiales bacterium]
MANGFKGKRFTVMGLGTRGGGVGVARFLVERGAVVTVTDMQPEDALAEPMRRLDGLPIRYILGRHDERDFTPDGADVVVRNPGVRRSAPLLQLARASGVRVEMEMSIFFRACPAPIIGITGTKGKTTTATICAGMLAAWDQRTVLAGNMGVSAVEALDRITAETPVVIELSSWQLEALDEHLLAPHIAVLTNISEDHLDTYQDFADYACTKRSITAHQALDDILLVNADDNEAFRAAEATNARVVPFGRLDQGSNGIWCDGAVVKLRRAGEEARVEMPPNPSLAGPHQAANVAAAAGAAFWRGASLDAITRGLERFGGVKDRMEPVAEISEVVFVNDTAATAPAAAVAALERFAGRRVHLISGGAAKQTNLGPVAAAARRWAHVVYLLDGTATPGLRALLEAEGVRTVGPFGSMEGAVRAAHHAACAGDVVLLSPGCASFGLFRDEFDRGDRFRAAVATLAARSSGEGNK